MDWTPAARSKTQRSTFFVRPPVRRQKIEAMAAESKAIQHRFSTFQRAGQSKFDKNQRFLRHTAEWLL